MKNKMNWFIKLFVLFGLFGCQPQEVEIAPARTPDEELATFRLAPGIKAQLVASEPMVQEPVGMTFDENGRLWVIEMRGFMPDIDRNGEDLPTGRISVLFDNDGDGRMDSSVVFLDSLVLPRALAVVKGGALVAENKPLWFAQDLNGDLIADKKILIDSVYGGNAMPEHSPNGLWRGVDNLYYNAKAKFRIRRNGDSWQEEPTEFRGQWGISHDDAGRLHYNYNWSQLHADLVPPNYLSRNPNHSPNTGIDHGLTLERHIFPVRPNPAVNRGYIPGTLDEEGKLLEFTAACSPYVYRGDAFPPEFLGNAFVCEPSGNLVKRNRVTESGYSLSAYGAYKDREFLASTDERFRPVALASGPDGALYIADMYRGIMQHGPYMTPYLREQTIKRGLDKHIHLGRIWRIVPEDFKQPKIEKLAALKSEALLPFLSHPNGWYRDMAQRLLVERMDTMILPLLRNLAINGAEAKGRFHALWTLQGLGNQEPFTYFTALSDKDPHVAATAIRQLESIARIENNVLERLESWATDNWENLSPLVLLQLTLSAEVFSVSKACLLYSSILKNNAADPLMRDAVMSGLHNKEWDLLSFLWTDSFWQEHQPEKEIFLEMLCTAIVNSKNPNAIKNVLALLPGKNQDWDWKQQALVNSLSLYASAHPDESYKLKKAPDFLGNKHNISTQFEKKLASTANLFTWAGKPIIEKDTTGMIVLTEAELQQFAAGRQIYLNVCAGCHGMDGMGVKRFAPPLAQSEWVLGDERLLTHILLHGMEGPVAVNGKTYNQPEILPVMPSLSTMADGEIAAVLTYIRNEWGNQAPAIAGRSVGRFRFKSQGKLTPWKAEELLNLDPEPEN